MFWKIYEKLCYWLAPFFIITTFAFGAIALYRGELILGLQNQLLDRKDQQIKVVIEQQQAANKVSQQYEQRKADREEAKASNDIIIEKVITESTNSNLCFEPAWLQQINSSAQSINSASQPASAVSKDSGDK